jgi:hypothetical protein
VSSNSPAYVVRVDLESDADEIRKTRLFSAFQRSRAPEASEGTLNASRVVVVGSPDEMLSEAATLTKIISAQSVTKVICVVRGAGGGYEELLNLPRELNLAPVAALWVDDPSGVLWAMRTAKADALTVHLGDPHGDLAFELLVDTIRAPEVFDDVFGKAKELGTLVSPALRVLVPAATETRLNERAEAAAVSALTSGGRPNFDASINYVPSDLDSRAFLFGHAPVPAEFFDAQGRVGRLSRENDARLVEVDTAIADLMGRPPLTHRPVERADSAIRSVGESLVGLKAELVELFRNIDGSDGINAGEVKRLRSAGLRPGSTRSTSANGSDESEILLPMHALSDLRRTRSLKEVVGDLRHIEERATPRSAEATLALLDDTAQDSMIEAIRDHPPLRLPVSDSTSLLVIFVMFVGAGSMWGVSWLLIAFLLCALGGFFFLITHPMSEILGISPRELWRSLRTRQVYLVAGTALFGVSAGIVIRGDIGGAAIHFAGLLVALGALAYLAHSVWRRSSKRWLNAFALTDARDAAQRMLEVTAVVAMNDWVLAESRVRFATVAGKLAGSFEAARVALLAELAPGAATTTIDAGDEVPQGDSTLQDEPPQFSCNPAVKADLSDVGGAALYKHSAMLEEIVVQDYLDAITSAIEDQWTLVAIGDHETGERVVVSALRRRLHWYRQDLRAKGLFGTRASVDGRDENALSGEGRRRRWELLAELWQSLDVEAMLVYAVDSELVQMCSAETLGVLNQDPGSARITRFAPQTSSAKSAQGEIVRTASMLMAGVIRLVPLRSGTISFGHVDASSPA